MTLCAGCSYPVPSWQHNGACKPVAEKVPPILRAADYPSLAKVWGNTADDVYAAEAVTPEDETVTRGNKRYGSPAERQKAYRARKRQSS